MLPAEWIDQARQRIAPYIERTPLFYDADNDLFLKWESVQVTGSFKVRGALNKVLSLQDWERENGLVAASAGNHGLGTALAGKITGTKTDVFVPEDAVPLKLEKLAELGAAVHRIPGGYPAAERSAKMHAAATGSAWISPYNDAQIIAGQATIALEVLEDLPKLVHAAWIAPVGGGGLIAGIGCALQAAHSEHSLFGVQAENSPFVHSLFYHGHQQGILEKPTLADGLAGEIEGSSLTIPLMKRFVQDFVLVSEQEIQQAMRFAWERYGEPVEPSAATALAAALTGKVSLRPAVLIITGGNVQPELHAKICLAEKNENE